MAQIEIINDDTGRRTFVPEKQLMGLPAVWRRVDETRDGTRAAYDQALRDLAAAAAANSAAIQPIPEPDVAITVDDDTSTTPTIDSSEED